MSAQAVVDLSNYGALRTQVEEAFPWISSWLKRPVNDPPGRGGNPVLLPRDFLRTPLALSLVQLDWQEGAYLGNAQAPWRALQWMLQMYYALNTPRLCVGAPLHQAIVLGDTEGAGELLRQHGAAALDGVMRNGQTGLTLATLLGRSNMVQLLLNHGFNPAAMDLLGNTALHWANIVREPYIAAMLLERGAPAAAENLLGAQPEDYDTAWDQNPPDHLSVDLVHQDGSTRTLNHQAEFRQIVGYEHLPTVRPGVDFFMQMAVGVTQPHWVKDVHAEMRQCPPFPREGFAEVPMFLKDFGAPWGWGVCTRVDIAQGMPVTSYIGDLVHTYETMVEVLNYGVNPYISNAQPTARLQELFMSHFDAWRSGNFGSRINSAEYDGAQCLRFQCRFWRGLPRSQFFAMRPIAAGEQLSWYYGDGYWAAHGFEARPLPQF